MNPFRALFAGANMLYAFAYYLLAVVQFACAALWSLFALIGAGTPFVLAITVALWTFGKLLPRRPTGQTAGAGLAGKRAEALQRLLTIGDDPDDCRKSLSGDWAIAYRGADFDAPGNSLGALQLCLRRRCRLAMLDLNVTRCGQLVLLHRSTVAAVLRRHSATEIAELTMADLRGINIVAGHPLDGQFAAEPVLTLDELLRQLPDLSGSVVFLRLADGGPQRAELMALLGRAIDEHGELFRDRLVVCASSMHALYALRNAHPDVVYALWLDRSSDAELSTAEQTAGVGRRAKRLAQRLPASGLWRGLRTQVHRLLAPIVGISLVFVSTDEYNESVKNAWYAAGVRPIVYTINMPNDKLYYQRKLRTFYLTQTVRTEPQMLLAANRTNGALPKPDAVIESLG